MKLLCIGLGMIVLAIIMMGIQIRSGVICSYEFEKNYLQEWQLADKSSTIVAKQQHISEFVKRLESGLAKTNDEEVVMVSKFAPYDAIWLKTSNNSFKSNLIALKTLSTRLNEISTMNPNSFEYNTAISQITSQEQGEAKEMIAIFEGCYALANYKLVWGWIGGLWLCGYLSLGVIGCGLIVIALDDGCTF